ncbi:MAG: hypothetical protein M3Z10_04410 [Gemmatimonadota bacterium]|nr:hypothetical protein [Gemmatimonadota bacterium]
MTERRYSEDEVAAIFRAAAEGPRSSPLPGGQGEALTRRDLQVIAREVDIAPDAITRAAQSLDRAPVPAMAQTFLGLPIAVERTVALPRRLTDAEWELLVVELRQVFRARGTVRAQGSLREWSNGNLQALLEPTPNGQQLRIRTFKGDARASVAIGTLALGMSAVVGVMVGAPGALAAAGPGIAALATIGAALIANGALRLPSWARQRRQQMDGVVERLMAATQ